MKATQIGASNMANTIYILYLVGLFVGITEIIGVILAYMQRKDAEDWLATHYTFQIRTFWTGLLMLVIAVPLMFIFIGFLIIPFFYIWVIVRCVKGIQYLSKQQAHPNPETWMFD